MVVQLIQIAQKKWHRENLWMKKGAKEDKVIGELSYKELSERSTRKSMVRTKIRKYVDLSAKGEKPCQKFK